MFWTRFLKGNLNKIPMIVFSMVELLILVNLVGQKFKEAVTKMSWNVCIEAFLIFLFETLNWSDLAFLLFKLLCGSKITLAVYEKWGFRTVLQIGPRNFFVHSTRYLIEYQNDLIFWVSIKIEIGKVSTFFEIPDKHD